MSIQKLEEGFVYQVCDACGAKRRVEQKELKRGEGRLDEGLIAMPPCDACEAREYLACSKGDLEHPSPGSFGHLHRLLVDEVHRRIEQDKGMSDEAPVNAYPRLQAELEKWLGGLEIERTVEGIHGRR